MKACHIENSVKVCTEGFSRDIQHHFMFEPALDIPTIIGILCLIGLWLLFNKPSKKV